VTTSWSPARLADSSALSSSGRRASFVDEDLIAAGRCQGVTLGVGVLIAGRDPSVADLHAQNCNANPRGRDIAADTGCVTDPTWADVVAVGV
jgi:hypothetical protein